MTVTAEDDDFMALLGQARAELLDVPLHAAEARGNAPLPDHRNLQLRAPFAPIRR